MAISTELAASGPPVVSETFGLYADIIYTPSHTCVRCHQERPDEEFCWQGMAARYRTRVCLTCRRSYRVENLARYREHQRRRMSDPVRKGEARAQLAASRVRTDFAGRGRASRAATRAEGIAAYGGCCTCCGESQPQFMTIDHIHGRTDADMVNGRPISGSRMIEMLKKRGWPRDNYQLLCFNCNCAKGFFGVCPHVEALDVI